MRKILLLSGQEKSYTNKIKALFGSSLIGYWPMDEAAGGTMYDQSGNGRNGTHTGATLGQPGIGDGKTCPSYDGINDFSECNNAGFLAAVNPLEGSIMLWCKVANTGVWTDGVDRYVFQLYNPGFTNISCMKSSVANSIWTAVVDGGYLTKSPYSNTNWFHIAITWSHTNNYSRFFIDGVEVVPAGVYATHVGTPTTLYISSYWSGWLAHFFVLNRPATAGEITQAALK